MKELGDTQFNFVFKEEKKGGFRALTAGWGQLLQAGLLRCDGGLAKGRSPGVHKLCPHYFVPSVVSLAQCGICHTGLLKRSLSLKLRGYAHDILVREKQQLAIQSLLYNSNRDKACLNMLYICEYAVRRKDKSLQA